ncbi:MAG TPA: NAD-dependent epimerase/dehydratase family protein [Rubricoccaceae bacterium]|nr:NAD-dependent epimerase/dehydratase family protein [Rubricoccaceae bacterium]
MKKVLVTGGAGFVGRHFVRRLLKRGDEVHCVDNVAPFTGGVHPDDGWPLFDPRDHDRFHFYGEDCRAFFLQRQDSDFDEVYHLAAIVGGRLVIEHNPLAVADDLAIDAAYWQWAVKAQPAKSVIFSSSAAYPITLQRRDHYVLLREDMISFEDDLGMPDLSYGWSKLTVEYLSRLAYERHGLKSVCYRPFSGYGEDQDDTYPFPSICKRALAHRGEPVLTVWGSGLQMRDFIHVEDCVTGVLTTMGAIDDGDAVNLSTGIYTSFIDFARLAAELCGYTPEVKGTSDKPEGVFARGGDTAKQAALGFTPTIEFREGIARALAYYEAQAA